MNPQTLSQKRSTPAPLHNTIGKRVRFCAQMPVREIGVIFAHPQFAKYPFFPDSSLILPPVASCPALRTNHEAQGRMLRAVQPFGCQRPRFTTLAINLNSQ